MSIELESLRDGVLAGPSATARCAALRMPSVGMTSGGRGGGRGEDEKTRSGEVEGLAVLGRPQGSPLRVEGGGLNGRSKVKVQSAKLWDPDWVGMAF